MEEDLRSCCLRWSMVAEMVSCSLPPVATTAELSAPATSALLEVFMGLVTAGLSRAAEKVLSIVTLVLLLATCVGCAGGCWEDCRGCCPSPLWLEVTALMRSADGLDSESAQHTSRGCHGAVPPGVRAW